MKRLIFFTTGDCPNCDKIKTNLGSIKIPLPLEEVEMSSNFNTCIHYGVQIAPTLLMLDNENEEIKRLSGEVLEPTDLEKWIND